MFKFLSLNWKDAKQTSCFLIGIDPLFKISEHLIIGPSGFLDDACVRTDMSFTISWISIFHFLVLVEVSSCLRS